MSRRQTQDFCAWTGYGTAEFWEELLSNPALAKELICQYVAELGAINPTEPTSASIAAAIALVMWGARASLIPDDDLEDLFWDVKALA